MDDQRRELTDALTRTDDELLASLAGDLFGDELGALPGPARRDRARRWLDRLVDDRRDELCQAPAVRQLLEQDKFDDLEEVLAIAGALADVAGLHGSSLIAAAVLIARRGLRALCARA